MNVPLRSQRPAGFSLIEMLVAMVILSLSLGVLYQATAGATRNVRLDERYTYAVQIAQSLLAEYPYVPPQGVSSTGEMGDMHWVLSSAPYVSGLPAVASSEADDVPRLQQLVASVRWDGSDARELRLTTVVPEFEAPVLPEPINAR